MFFGHSSFDKTATLNKSKKGYVMSFFHKLQSISLMGFVLISSSCAVGAKEQSLNNKEAIKDNSQYCDVSNGRYPTTAEDFSDKHLLYGHRGFLDVYANHKHLGRDIIYPAGTEIHPILCGKIVFYGPASGYGTLVAVVEHQLPDSIMVINGDKKTIQVSSFLSIYGHLTREYKGIKLPWKVGDSITTQDSIGFIQKDSLNGDGPEHLHLGIRIQSYAQAKKTESLYWFRGNDSAGEGTYKKYYTDPQTFIPKLINNLSTSEESALSGLHHPIGTILSSQQGKYWIVSQEDSIVPLPDKAQSLQQCAVLVSDEELSCYYHQNEPVEWSKKLLARQVKFDGSSQVFRIMDNEYSIYLNYGAFLSWGGNDASIEHYSADQKQMILQNLHNQGFIGYRPGSLVKSKDNSAVYVVGFNGKRRPIFNWDVFQALNYNSQCISDLEPQIIDQVAGLVDWSDSITLATTSSCPSQPNKIICQSGQKISCGCTATLSGYQECLSDLTGFSSCACEGLGGGSTPPDEANREDESDSDNGSNEEHSEEPNNPKPTTYEVTLEFCDDPQLGLTAIDRASLYAQAPTQETICKSTDGALGGASMGQAHVIGNCTQWTRIFGDDIGRRKFNIKITTPNFTKWAIDYRYWQYSGHQNGSLGDFQQAHDNHFSDQRFIGIGVIRLYVNGQKKETVLLPGHNPYPNDAIESVFGDHFGLAWGDLFIVDKIDNDIYQATESDWICHNK